MDVDSVAYTELSADKSLAKPILHIWCDNHKMMQVWDSRLDSRQTIAGRDTCKSIKGMHPNRCTSSHKTMEWRQKNLPNSRKVYTANLYSMFFFFPDIGTLCSGRRLFVSTQLMEKHLICILSVATFVTLSRFHPQWYVPRLDLLRWEGSWKQCVGILAEPNRGAGMA